MTARKHHPSPYHVVVETTAALACTVHAYSRSEAEAAALQLIHEVAGTLSAAAVSVTEHDILHVRAREVRS